MKKLICFLVIMMLLCSGCSGKDYIQIISLEEPNYSNYEGEYLLVMDSPHALTDFNIYGDDNLSILSVEDRYNCVIVLVYSNCRNILYPFSLEFKEYDSAGAELGTNTTEELILVPGQYTSFILPKIQDTAYIALTKYQGECYDGASKMLVKDFDNKVQRKSRTQFKIKDTEQIILLLNDDNVIKDILWQNKQFTKKADITRYAEVR